MLGWKKDEQYIGACIFCWNPPRPELQTTPWVPPTTNVLQTAHNLPSTYLPTNTVPYLTCAGSMCGGMQSLSPFLPDAPVCITAL